MRGWLGLERAWCRALLLAMIPPGARHDGLTAEALEAVWPRLARAAPPLLRHGLRASVWCLTWLPLLWPGLWRPFGRLDPVRRDRFLEAAAGSRLHPLRQMVLAVKLVACWAFFGGHPEGRDGLPEGPP